jgi:hypothetical protein
MVLRYIAEPSRLGVQHISRPERPAYICDDTDAAKMRQGEAL